VGTKSEVARVVARRKREWRYIAEWLDDYGAIAASRDRTKLDFVLPDNFLRAVFRKIKIKFYLGRDGWLRSRRHSFWDKTLSAVRAFERFGGDAMEEALEYGSFQVIKH
jgi:hypothetical protein